MLPDSLCLGPCRWRRRPIRPTSTSSTDEISELLECLSRGTLTRLGVLERRLRLLADSIDAEWGDLCPLPRRGDEIGIDADRMIDTMSLIKVPILVALMRRVDRGEVDLGRRITLEEDHKRLGTGVLRLFDAGRELHLA